MTLLGVSVLLRAPVRNMSAASVRLPLTKALSMPCRQQPQQRLMTRFSNFELLTVSSQSALSTARRYNSSSSLGCGSGDNNDKNNKGTTSLSSALPPSTEATTTTTGANEEVQSPSVAAQLTEEDRQLLDKAMNNPHDLPASRLGGSGVGPASGELVAIFTCTHCETRSVKRFSKHSYEEGIVIVECPGCKKRHLMADNLGWFDDAQKNIVDIMRAKGREVLEIGYKSKTTTATTGNVDQKGAVDLVSMEVDGRQLNLADVLEMAGEDAKESVKPQDMQ